MRLEKVFSMTKSPLPSLPKTFYVASPLRALRPLILTCAATFGVFNVILPSDQHGALAVLIGIMAVALITATVFVFQSHLDISEREIVFSAPGYRVCSTWVDLTGCARRRIQTQRVEVLLTAQAEIRLSWWARGTKNRDFIPVSWFEKNHWRKGDLGRIIEHYAPHAFFRLLP
jgi:hypothetical protein